MQAQRHTHACACRVLSTGGSPIASLTTLTVSRHLQKTITHAASDEQTYLPSPERGWWLSCLPHQTERLFEILVSELHFSGLTPHSGEVIHVFQLHLSRLIEDDTRVGDVPVTLVELGERNPQAVWLSHSLQSMQKVMSKKMTNVPIIILTPPPPSPHSPKIPPTHALHCSTSTLWADMKLMVMDTF